VSEGGQRIGSSICGSVADLNESPVSERGGDRGLALRVGEGNSRKSIESNQE